MSSGITRGRAGVAMLAGVVAVGAGCQSPSHETGELYGVSEQFDGHVAQHMPLVFAKEQGEPWVVLTLCRKTTDTSRPEMASYNIHVTILSNKAMYDLQDERLEFIADDVRISLARVGMVESVPEEQAANYPISVQDLRTFAAADEVMVRINTADVRMERDLDPTHLAAMDEFYLVCVEQAPAPRHAGVND